jgi:hypothetical protein
VNGKAKAAVALIVGLLVLLALWRTMAPEEAVAPTESPAESPAPTPLPDPSADLRTEIERLKQANAELTEENRRLQLALDQLREQAGATPGDEDCTVRVLVTNETGQAKPRTKVSLHLDGLPYPRNERDAVTGPDGVAVFETVPVRKASASVRRGGGIYRQAVKTAAGAVVEVALAVPSGGCRITGGVRDRVKGPLPGVNVYLNAYARGSSVGFTAETDGQGRYEFQEVPEGQYYATAMGGPLPSNRPVRKMVDVPAGGTLVVDFTTGVPSLEGTVRDAATGRPIPGVSVRAGNGGGAATTDGEGRYELYGVRPGAQKVQAGCDGYGYAFLKDVEVVEGGSRLDITLRPAATVRFTVTMPGGEPFVGRVHLSLKPKSEGGSRYGTSVSTDGEGRAVSRRILPGEYDLSLSVQGVGRAVVPAKLVLGENEVKVELE